MREILGKRRRLLSQRSDGRPELISAALTFAAEWQWPVLPGVAPDPQGRARCGCPDPECTVPGAHPFDQVCQCHGVRHKLTRPYRPQTNGMAERFNRRLAEALQNHPPAAGNAGKNRFRHHAQRNAFIQSFVNDYNRTRLRCLGHKAPAELLANLTGHNTQAGTHQAAAQAVEKWVPACAGTTT